MHAQAMGAVDSSWEVGVVFQEMKFRAMEQVSRTSMGLEGVERLVRRVFRARDIMGGEVWELQIAPRACEGGGEGGGGGGLDNLMFDRLHFAILTFCALVTAYTVIFGIINTLTKFRHGFL